jgi:glycine dehydrogenase
MGYGGPHAAYMAVRDALKRSLPGRIVGCRWIRAGPGLSAGAADPRAAYPPRKGHLQHLHRAGAAGGDRLDVRGLSRPGRAAAHRAHGAPRAAVLAAGLRKLGFARAKSRGAFFDT